MNAPADIRATSHVIAKAAALLLQLADALEQNDLSTKNELVNHILQLVHDQFELSQKRVAAMGQLELFDEKNN